MGGGGGTVLMVDAMAAGVLRSAVARGTGAGFVVAVDCVLILTDAVVVGSGSGRGPKPMSENNQSGAERQRCHDRL